MLDIHNILDKAKPTTHPPTVSNQRNLAPTKPTGNPKRVYLGKGKYMFLKENYFCIKV